MFLSQDYPLWFASKTLCLLKILHGETWRVLPTQVPFDPCLFISKKVVVICYVDDLFYWAMHNMDNFDLVIQLQGEEGDLKQEDDAV